MALKVMEEYRKTQIPAQSVSLLETEGREEGSGRERGGRDSQTNRACESSKKEGGRDAKIVLLSVYLLVFCACRNQTMNSMRWSCMSASCCRSRASRRRL